MSINDGFLDNYKFVDFDKYCPRCAHQPKAGTLEPCNECLDIPARLYSHMPEYFDEAKSEPKKVNGMPTALRRITKYLYAADYADIDYDAAKEYLKTDADLEMPGACSAFKDGDYYCRNFDWTYDNSAEFVVNVQSPKGSGRYKSKGMAGGIKIFTEEFVKDNMNDDNDLYVILPFLMRDGINECGVFAEINVVPTWNPDNKNTSIPTVREDDQISALMLVRYILDNFSTAYAAVRYIKYFVSVYFPKALHNMGYECHWMIGDKTDTYCLEIVDNEIIINEVTASPFMTNFHLYNVEFNDDGMVYTPDTQDETHNAVDTNHIHPLGAGLERYNFIVRSVDCDYFDCLDILDGLKYTNSYNPNKRWLTEFVGLHGLQVDSDPEDFEPVLAAAHEAYVNRCRDFGDTWQTCHSVVYNPVTYSMTIAAQEDGYYRNF